MNAEALGGGIAGLCAVAFGAYAMVKSVRSASKGRSQGESSATPQRDDGHNGRDGAE